MHRIIYMMMMVILFSTVINVIIALNQIQINTQTKNGLIASLNSQKVGVENQKIIIDNQKQIFSYSANQTKTDFVMLEHMMENQTNKILKALPIIGGHK